MSLFLFEEVDATALMAALNPPAPDSAARIRELEKEEEKYIAGIAKKVWKDKNEGQ